MTDSLYLYLNDPPCPDDSALADYLASMDVVAMLRKDGEHEAADAAELSAVTRARIPWALDAEDTGDGFVVRLSFPNWGGVSAEAKVASWLDVLRRDLSRHRG